VRWRGLPSVLGACAAIGCAAGTARPESDGGGAADAGLDGGATDAGLDGGATDGGAADGGSTGCRAPGDGGCYASACEAQPRSLRVNRDRLLGSLATRKSATSCALWAALNLAERTVFLMVTAYLGDSASRLYPPGFDDSETALDHA